MVYGISKRIIIVQTCLMVALSLLMFGRCFGADANQVVKATIISGTPVNAVALSPDGSLLATGHDSGDAVRIWDMVTGKELRSLKVDSVPALSTESVRTQGSIYAVAFSPDGKMFAAGGGGRTVYIWDTNGWGRLRKIDYTFGSIGSIAFSPDGKVMAVGVGNTVSLVEAGTWNKLRDLDWHSIDVNTLVFGPRENVLASGGSDRTIMVWDFATGKRLHLLDGRSKAVQSIDISPDGETLISGGNYPNFVLWHMKSGSRLKMLRTMEGMVMSVKYSPQGDKVAAGFKNGAFALIDIKSGIRRTEYVHRATVYSLAISKDGKLIVTGDAAGKIVLWDAEALGRYIPVDASAK